MFNYIKKGTIQDLKYSKTHEFNGIEKDGKIDSFRFVTLYLDRVEKIEKSYTVYVSKDDITAQVAIDENTYKVETSKVDNEGETEVKYYILTVLERV